jgi:hypothetical protein
MSQTDPTTIRADILTMVGGLFTPQALGREVYEEILGRARRHASEYLDVFASLFLGPNFDPVSQSDLSIPTFLQSLADVEPDRAKSAAAQLVKQYDAVLTFHDAAMDRAAFSQNLPEETVRLMQRFLSRRRELQTLLGP